MGGRMGQVPCTDTQKPPPPTGNGGFCASTAQRSTDTGADPGWVRGSATPST